MMRRFGMSTPQTIVAVAVLVIGGSVWALVGRSESANAKPKLPEELSVDALKKQMTEGQGRIGETMRNVFGRDDLTDEQRRQARRNMRRVWTDITDERIEAYNTAPEDQKQAVLDEQIDDFVERMERMREERARRQEEREKSGEEPATDEQRRERFRRYAGNQTRTQRKSRSESRSPDDSARRMAYRQTVRKRMQERGIETPRGRGGRSSRR